MLHNLTKTLNLHSWGIHGDIRWPQEDILPFWRSFSQMDTRCDHFLPNFEHVWVMALYSFSGPNSSHIIKEIDSFIEGRREVNRGRKRLSTSHVEFYQKERFSPKQRLTVKGSLQCLGGFQVCPRKGENPSGRFLSSYDIDITHLISYSSCRHRSFISLNSCIHFVNYWNPPKTIIFNHSLTGLD